MAEQKKKKVISVQDYREKISGGVQEVELPSGAIFQIKRLSPIDYLKEGLTEIPNDYFQFVESLTQGKVETDSPDAQKNYEIFEEFLRISIEKGVISPPMLLKWDKGKADDCLLFSELLPEDQIALVRHIKGQKLNE